MTDAVKKWLDNPSSNHGVLLYPQALLPRTVFTYYDKENGIGDQRPRLVIKTNIIEKKIVLNVEPKKIDLKCQTQGTFNLTLKDDQGNPIVGKQIVVNDRLNNSCFSTPATDNTGKTTYSINKGSKPQGLYDLEFVAEYTGYSNKAIQTSQVEIIPEDQNCYNIEISVEKNVFNLNEDLTFNISVKDINNNPIPNAIVAIYDPNPNILYCPSASTNQNGIATYKANTTGLDGYIVYGFKTSILGKNIEFDPIVMPLIIDNGKQNPAEITKIVNTDPSGLSKPLGSKQKPDLLNDMIDVGLQAGINTVTNPVIIGGAFLCGGGIVGSFYTAGATAPVPAVACPFTAEAAKLTFALEASKEASKKLVDYVEPNPNKNAEYKQNLDLVYTGIDFVFLVKGQLKAPKTGKSVLSYKISNNRGNFANQYATEFIDQLGNYYSVYDDISNLNFTGGKGQIVNINNETSIFALTCVVKDINNTSTDFDKYEYSTIAYSFNPNRPQKVKLNEPQNNSTNIETSVNFKWDKVQSSTKYHLQVSEDSTIMKSAFLKEKDEIQSSTFFVNDSNIVSNSKVISGLKQGQTKYFWRVRAFKNNLWGNWSSLNNFTTVQISDVEENINKNIPTITILPNPSYDNSDIIFSIEKNSVVSISIMNNLGIEVQRIIDNKEFIQGEYKFNFDSGELPAGIYHCTFIAGKHIIAKKFVIVK